jgi:hypothetical protein
MESVKWWVKLKALDILEGGEIGHFGNVFSSAIILI